MYADSLSLDAHFWQGKNNLDAVFTELNASHGLEQAERVIISGNSAGGLTVYTHLDRMRSMVRSAADVLGFPDGGYCKRGTSLVCFSRTV